jgi:hypothetical protein
MSLESLIRTVSNRCGRKGSTIWTLGYKYGWSVEDADEFIRGMKRPSAKMIRDIAKEFEWPVDYVQQQLDS